MWKQIKSDEEVNKISTDTILLKYSDDSDQINLEPTGNETNSDKYKVVKKLIDSFELESMLPNTSIGSFTVTSIKRHVTKIDLMNGSWWLNE